jgi:NTP pyrophosphatase (non-canonical NTP hydrolase)
MDLAALMKTQIAGDEKRGFPVRFGDDRERVMQLMKDLVGLFGEIGEFSNLIKKIGIKLDHPAYDGPSLSESRDRLREEVVDSFIYLMRLAAILETDLEAELLKKIQNNVERYKPLERT